MSKHRIVLFQKSSNVSKMLDPFFEKMMFWIIKLAKELKAFDQI